MGSEGEQVSERPTPSRLRVPGFGSTDGPKLVDAGACAEHRYRHEEDRHVRSLPLRPARHQLQGLPRSQRSLHGARRVLPHLRLRHPGRATRTRPASSPPRSSRGPRSTASTRRRPTGCRSPACSATSSASTARRSAARSRTDRPAEPHGRQAEPLCRYATRPVGISRCQPAVVALRGCRCCGDRSAARISERCGSATVISSRPPTSAACAANSSSISLTTLRSSTAKSFGSPWNSHVVLEHALRDVEALAHAGDDLLGLAERGAVEVEAICCCAASASTCSCWVFSARTWSSSARARSARRRGDPWRRRPRAPGGRSGPLGLQDRDVVDVGVLGAAEVRADAAPGAVVGGQPHAVDAVLAQQLSRRP